MSSASSLDRSTLEGYVAGRVKAERVVAAVVAAYYGEGGRGKREGLAPLIAVIERAAPGVPHLAKTESQPGFEIKLAERPFPTAYEAELKRAVEAVLAGSGSPASGSGEVMRETGGGVLSRILGALRRLLSASK